MDLCFSLPSHRTHFPVLGSRGSSKGLEFPFLQSWTCSTSELLTPRAPALLTFSFQQLPGKRFFQMTAVLPLSGFSPCCAEPRVSPRTFMIKVRRLFSNSLSSKIIQLFRTLGGATSKEQEKLPEGAGEDKLHGEALKMCYIYWGFNYSHPSSLLIKGQALYLSRAVV